MKALYQYLYRTIPLVLTAATIVIFSSGIAAGQNFEEGVELYEQGNYEEALQIFDQLHTDEARLFSGKSHFSMGNYLTAKAFLEQLPEDENSRLYLDAQYTLALTDFQLKQYGNTLTRLHRLQNLQVKTQLVVDAGQLYDQLLDFLTLNQRKEALMQATIPEVKFDIVAAAVGRVDLPVAKMLYAQLVNARVDSTHPKMRDLSEILSDSMNYAVEQTYNSTLNAPDGLTYNIGAALPTFDTDASEFEVAQGLYFGYVLAAEHFNQQHPDRKAFIRFENTASHVDSARHALTNLVWNNNVDAVLGPLFSAPAYSMAQMAEEYSVPMIAPLANSDTLNVDNPYFYQANPTFSSHGRRMAEYAVETLNMDTLAVLTEQNSRGETSAYAFRDRAEKLGAKVAYFMVDDLESKGFDLTEYTKYFTTDSAEVDSMNYHQVDGIYAPFTGSAATNLIELLMVDLVAMNNNATVFGSQQWGAANISEQHLRGRDIYFTESYYLNPDNEQVSSFTEEYKQRFTLEPNRFAMIGYDVASYLLQTLDEVENPALLKNALKNQPLKEGFTNDIFFDGTHINQDVEVFRITTDGTYPVQ